MFCDSYVLQFHLARRYNRAGFNTDKIINIIIYNVLFILQVINTVGIFFQKLQNLSVIESKKCQFVA